jgi:aspartyl-tRNA(Asn)/glutamyl-tRNA(Gln) amidotransferase subunit A
MNDDDLRALIDDPARRHEVTAVELLDAILTRIEDHARLGAFITLTPEDARACAREADRRRARGATRGPLDGLPVAVKDNIDLAGVPATAGSAWFRDRVPRSDAVVVRRLRGAGAAIVGKTNMHELAYGATNANPHFGSCGNAWDAERVAGGSSGGSGAALGADLCVVALGTDTGGSVRIPAALNGVTALRPTYGSVSNRGVLPISPSLDTVGSMARSAHDVGALARVLAGYDPRDPYAAVPLTDRLDGSPAPGAPRAPGSPQAPDGAQAAGGPPVADGARPLDGLRVAIARGFFFDDASPRVAANAYAAAEVLAELGAQLEEIDTMDAGRATADCSVLIRAEALAVHERRLARDPEGVGEDVRRRLELGRTVTGVEVARAVDRMRRWQMRMRAALARVDLILTPSAEVVAPRRGGADMIATTAHLTRLAYPWSFAGLPAISLPSGLGEHDLPTGVQLTAAPWRDELLVSVGVAFQALTSFHRQRPPTPVPSRA